MDVLEDWTLDALTELILRLRRAGIRAYQGSMHPDGSMVFTFERDVLGQKLAVETVLMAWPGVESVRHVAPGRVHACRQRPPVARAGRCRGWLRRG